MSATFKAPLNQKWRMGLRSHVLYLKTVEVSFCREHQKAAGAAEAAEAAR